MNAQAVVCCLLFVWSLSDFGRSICSTLGNLLQATQDVQITSPPPSFSPEGRSSVPSQEITNQVLDALAKVQMCKAIALNNASALSNAQQGLALLDAVDGDARHWVRGLLRSSSQAGDSTPLMAVMSATLKPPVSQSDHLFRLIYATAEASNLISLISTFCELAPTLGLSIDMLQAVFRSVLDLVYAHHEVWSTIQGSVDQIYASATTINALPRHVTHYQKANFLIGLPKLDANDAPISKLAVDLGTNLAITPESKLVGTELIINDSVQAQIEEVVSPTLVIPIFAPAKDPNLTPDMPVIYSVINESVKSSNKQNFAYSLCL